MDTIICSVHGDERLTEIVQGGLSCMSDLFDVPFRDHDPHRTATPVDNLAVTNLVLQSAKGMDADRVLAGAQFGLFGHFDLGDDAAHCRVPPWEVDASCLADQAASTVAPDEIFRPQRLAVGQLDVDAGVVLREAGHLASAMDWHPEFADPVRQYALDPVLPKPEPVGVPCGKIADVQTDPSETCDLRHLPLRKEPIGDSALIEHFDGACVQTACARASDVLADTPLDNRNVDARQRQFAGQHQPGWACAYDENIGICHGHRCTPRFRLRRRFYGMAGVLKQVPCAPHIKVGGKPLFPPFQRATGLRKNRIVFGAAQPDHTRMKTCYVIFNTALGFAGIAWSDGGVTRFQLPCADAHATTRNLLRRAPGAEAAVPPPAVAQIVEAAKRYFAGEMIDFSGVTLDLAGQDDLFREIYAAARRIGYGETTTYGGLAKAIGRTDWEAARDVGQAMAKNPVPLIIPCHRVLAAGGKIGGFSAPGGAETKAKMLALEGVKPRPQQRVLGL